MYLSDETEESPGRLCGALVGQRDANDDDDDEGGRIGCAIIHL